MHWTSFPGGVVLHPPEKKGPRTDLQSASPVRRETDDESMSINLNETGRVNF